MRFLDSHPDIDDPKRRNLLDPNMTMKLSLVGILVALITAQLGVANDYLIGRSKSDITLPVWGIQMLGYVHPQQVSEGLRQHQYARTFVIADPEDNSRLAITTCELAFVTHTLKLAVLERLQEKLGERYNHANVILTGTHTHGTPGGYHHHLSVSMLGGDFFPEAFDELAEGIAESIAEADADLKPGSIFLAQGEVFDANANRSHIAYRNNPKEERARYEHPVDKGMTLLKFVRDDGAIGLLNWFAVHPTSISYNSKLITSDNKGYAAYVIEKEHNADGDQLGEFVAAFANSNAGDATPNLNLDGTGPGQTEVESCAMIGTRQAETARQLCDSARQRLQGPIKIQHRFVDFSQVSVSEAFTSEGNRQTSPSAWGYSFAAGSDAEGGGHPLFREGMTETDPGIETLIRLVMPKIKPTEEFLERQKPKAVLIATGLAEPPMHEQVLPLSVVQLGQIVLVVGPAEFTTMTGRRFRAAVGSALGVSPELVVVAGYANDLAGYVTTWHEYQLQQYEGGHTLFGPWTEAAYRQEFVKLAKALSGDESVESSAEPVDMRTRPHRQTNLNGPDETTPEGAKFGDPLAELGERYSTGETVSATFWTGSPVNEYDREDAFLAIEQREGDSDQWKIVRVDNDWDTTATWRRISSGNGSKNKQQRRILDLAPPPYSTSSDPFQVTIEWTTTEETPPGTYRIVHYGRYKAGGEVKRFTAHSTPFAIE